MKILYQKISRIKSPLLSIKQEILTTNPVHLYQLESEQLSVDLFTAIEEDHPTHIPSMKEKIPMIQIFNIKIDLRILDNKIEKTDMKNKKETM